jgi:hypothetical protein
MGVGEREIGEGIPWKRGLRAHARQCKDPSAANKSRSESKQEQVPTQSPATNPGVW